MDTPRHSQRRTDTHMGKFWGDRFGLHLGMESLALEPPDGGTRLPRCNKRLSLGCFGEGGLPARVTCFQRLSEKNTYRMISTPAGDLLTKLGSVHTVAYYTASDNDVGGAL